LAAHFIQRKRADIKHFLSTDTPFPTGRSGNPVPLVAELQEAFRQGAGICP
jgi:hypothetical protein